MDDKGWIYSFTKIGKEINGNISSSTPAGTYTYNATRLHAVASVTNPSGNIDTTKQNVDYTSYDKVKKITQGIYELQITYAVDKGRGMTVQKVSGIEKKRKYFAHGNYEKLIENGVTRELHYIAGGTGLVAIFQKKAAGDSMFYVHTDHLGSLNVITNLNGAIKEELSFDAWGRRRNPANWTFTGVSSTYSFDRGYTGHEHLAQFGLINMNGRVYDPLLGRFLSPDIVVQNTTYTQSYNRYSYCLGNPLKYTDPSGYKAYLDIHINLETVYDNRGNPIGWRRPGSTHTSGGGGGNVFDPIYRYNRSMGEYMDIRSCDIVGWGEVYNNYVLPKGEMVYHGGMWDYEALERVSRWSNGAQLVKGAGYVVTTGKFYIPELIQVTDSRYYTFYLCFLNNIQRCIPLVHVEALEGRRRNTLNVANPFNNSVNTIPNDNFPQIRNFDLTRYSFKRGLIFVTVGDNNNVQISIDGVIQQPLTETDARGNTVNTNQYYIEENSQNLTFTATSNRTVGVRVTIFIE